MRSNSGYPATIHLHTPARYLRGHGQSRTDCIVCGIHEQVRRLLEKLLDLWRIEPLKADDGEGDADVGYATGDFLLWLQKREMLS